MSSTLNPSGMKPLYTREILNNAEAALATASEYIDFPGSDGNIRIKNMDKDTSRDLAPGSKGWRNVIEFRDERALRRLEALEKADQFFPVYPHSTLFYGPNKTKEETRERFAAIIEKFEASEEAAAIANMIRNELKNCTVDKVIAFGLGRIGFIRDERSQTFYEHAAARVVASVVREVSSSPTVVLLSQEPLYTEVCRDVLSEFGIEIIEGLGAKGFALVDDNTIVLTHNPGFPLREIVADLARPALISMKGARVGAMPLGSQGIPDVRADVESSRSRKMLKEYRYVHLPVARQRAFWANRWYVRSPDANQQ
ncbi:hypothetical protein F4825DRAFT_436192 [Nemania diffusa]|nr:hypothetical protein F4825DRAFT_436192 [Nemania diffusa]